MLQIQIGSKILKNQHYTIEMDKYNKQNYSWLPQLHKNYTVEDFNNQQFKMSVIKNYSGKRILLTGSTGFVGKVVLEKFLYSVSSVQRIYILIRNKEGCNISQRFNKEVMSSACFDRLRKIHKAKFKDFFCKKVYPIQGDLQKPQLGLTAEMRRELIESCTIIVNCAASIDFNSRIDFAIETNIKGALRVLELAGSLKRLDIFTHISTCYVNSDMRGLVKEEIYERQLDPEATFKKLEEMPLNELIANTKEIIGKYPNTYTFTKSLCERLIKKRKGTLPVCIVRPAIVNNSYMEPFPGWIDSLAACTVVQLYIGLGVIQEMKCDRMAICDIVPVDVVSNIVIVATALNMNNPNLPIYHASSSDCNPILYGTMWKEVVEYWKKNAAQSKALNPSIYLSQAAWQLKANRIKRAIPIKAYQRLASLLGEEHQKTANKMEKSLARGTRIAQVFQFFLTHSWVFEYHNLKYLSSQMSAQERSEFLMDVKELDIQQFVRLNNYGIQHYYLKENTDSLQTLNVLQARDSSEYLSDVKWAWGMELSANGKQAIAEMKTKIFSSSKVLKTIEAQAARRCKQNGKLSKESAVKEAQIEVENVISSLVGESRVPMMRSMAWLLHKAFKTLYERVNVNEEMLEEIRRIEKNRGVPIVLLPTHRSSFDFLIVSYIFFVSKLRLPFCIQDQSLLQSSILPFVANSCGAFFFDKAKYSASRTYKAVFDTYVELLIYQGNTIEFFIEYARSRTGRMQPPCIQVLNIVLQTMLMGKVPQVFIVPLTINYERAFECDVLNELSGEKKTAGSLLNLIKVTPKIMESYGRVYVEICRPILGRQFLHELKTTGPNNLEQIQSRQYVLSRLGKQITNRMAEGIVVMSTAIVSSVLLIYPKGISEDELMKAVNEISHYILKKGHKVGGINEYSAVLATKNAIGYLSGIASRNKNYLSPGTELHKILMLSYYRNTLAHAFLPEAFVACTLSAFSNELTLPESVNLSTIYTKSAFLIRLFGYEHFRRHTLEDEYGFEKSIGLMVDNDIVELQQGQRVSVLPQGTMMLAFYYSLLRPELESFWASLIYIKSIAKRSQRRQAASSLNKLFDSVQWFVGSLYGEKMIEDYSSCSRELIKNAFEKFEKLKLIKIVAGGKEKEAWIEVLVGLDQINELENEVKFFRKNAVTSSGISPMEVARSSIKELANSKL